MYFCLGHNTKRYLFGSNLQKPACVSDQDKSCLLPELNSPIGSADELAYVNAFVIKQCPVVQSVVSLTTSLRVISLTVLADPIHNIVICFAEKNVSSFCTAKATHIFSAKHFRIFAYHWMHYFNESLTNDVVSFEQLGPGCHKAVSLARNCVKYTKYIHTPTCQKLNCKKMPYANRNDSLQYGHHGLPSS